MTTAGSLPEEMVVQILVRTPVRWVLGLRVVCKSWNSIISNPQFALRHLNHTQKTKHILLVGFSLTDPRKSVSLFRPNHQQRTLFDVLFGRINKSDYFKILNFRDCFQEMVVAGSINGVICICSYHFSFCRFVALWNPVINRWKPIFLPTPSVGDSKLTSVGLAFDSLTNDYKIIVIVNVPSMQVPSSRVLIYSANHNSWLTLKSLIPYYTIQPNCSVIVKGVPYWSKNYTDFVHYRHCKGYLQTNVIATIDPHTGLYKGILYPQIVMEKKTTAVLPINMMDSLALLVYSPGKNSNKMLHLYTLDDTSDTWIKKYSTGQALLPLKKICIIRYFEDAGKTLVVGWDFDRDRNFFYDPEFDCLYDTIGLEDFQPRWDECYHHSESLVSINGMEPVRIEADDYSSSGMCRGRPLFPPL